jgi:hypothetical protein
MKKMLFIMAGIAIVVVISACASGPKMITLPMTPMLIDEVGVENMEKLSYFLSKDISLERQNTAPDNVLFEKGVAIRIDKSVKETIKISHKTPGLASFNAPITDTSYINYRVLGIEFEDEDNTKVGFAVPLSRPDGRFYMLFDDEENGAVLYGDNVYRVGYLGDERPYLLVRLARDTVHEELIRKASGRPIE